MLFGTVTGAMIAVTLNELGKIDTAGMFILTGFSILGSLLPDIDKQTTTLGQVVKPVSTILEKTIGHRTYTHDLVLNMILCVICFIKIPFNDYTWLFPLITGLWIGIFGHLFLDSLTANGLPVLYLFNKKHIHLTPYKYRFYSGENKAKAITVICSIIFVCINLLVIEVTVGLAL